MTMNNPTPQQANNNDVKIVDAPKSKSNIKLGDIEDWGMFIFMNNILMKVWDKIPECKFKDNGAARSSVG